MNRAWAAVGSAVFFALAPGVVAGVVPFWLTGWEASDLPGWWLPGWLDRFLPQLTVEATGPAPLRGAGTRSPRATSSPHDKYIARRQA